MLEQWRDVPGYEGLYQVSDRGRVRGRARQGTKGGLLSLNSTKAGYWKVGLYNGTRKAAWVHRLVLEAFVGPAPTGLIACHCNGEPRDNRLTNLRWDTHASNYDDARKHGTAAIGELNPMTKVTAEDRRVIRQMRDEGALQREIAAKLGLSQQHVSYILAEELA